MELWKGEKIMKFMQFIREVDKGREFFVGKSEQAILDLTYGGTKHGSLSYKSHTTVEREVIPAANLRRFTQALVSVEAGETQAAWLGIEM